MAPSPPCLVGGSMPHTDNPIPRGLKRIMCSSIPCGGVTVLLVGDPAQLPPVKGQTLWNQNSSNADDSRGFNVYRFFTSVVELVENNRMDRSDPDAVLFYDFLQKFRDGKALKIIGIS